MAAYQIWVESDAYAKLAYIKSYLRLTYKVCVNGMGWATLEMSANDSQIAALLIARRLKIIRNGAIVFGGRLLREGWAKPPEAPAGEVWTVTAWDHAHYAKRRLIVPAAGQMYDTRTDNADDVAKDYVYYHCGAGAAAARQLSDLTVEADENAAASLTANGRYQSVYDMLLKLHDQGAFDWRFTPVASGCTFETGYPQYGLDRTKGNGVNAECVFVADRRNFYKMGYEFDAADHANYVYVGGQGEGADRAIVERSTAGDITTYGRCEDFADARHLTLVASLQAYGDGVLLERKPVKTMIIEPEHDTWKSLYDLGDLVTIYAYEWGRTFSMNAKVVAANVLVSPDGLEQVAPELEATA